MLNLLVGISIGNYIECAILRIDYENEIIPRNFTKEGRDALFRYPWPGNIRELENAVERAVVLTRSNLIIPEDLPIIVKDTAKESSLKLDDLERHHIEKVLKLTKGNISQTASLLGIHRNTLREKIKRLGLQS